MISPRDEALLERYFSHGHEERSPMGGQLDHLEMFSYREPHSGVIDARPTREIRQNAKDGPDDGLLAILGAASRRLSVVRKTDPRSYAVLAAYYGDSGATYARGDHGRIGSLVHMTPSGQALVKRQKLKAKGSKVKVSDEQHMANASDVTAVALKSNARTEAVAMLTKAHEAWGSTAVRRAG
jgi:hypothetical protein